jgi:hypothetical protein
LFNGIDRPALESVAASTTVEPIDVGTVLAEEGHTADAVFVVAAGVLSDRSAGRETLRVLGPGDWFGEVGLVERRPRATSVVAEHRATLLRIPGDVFVGVVGVDAGRPLPEPLRRGIAGRLGASVTMAETGARGPVLMPRRRRHACCVPAETERSPAPLHHRRTEPGPPGPEQEEAMDNKLPSTMGTDHPGQVLRGSHRYEADDTEGHMPRVRWFEDALEPDEADAEWRRPPSDAGVDDAEGHGRKGGGAWADDAEGHARKPPSDAGVDDAEGHGRRFPTDAGVDDAEGHGRKFPSDAGVDDAEGHARRPPSDAGLDDAEGHGRRPPSDAGLDDAEGHGHRKPADAGVDDAEGHGRRVPSDAGVDDAEGHVNFRPLDRSADR